MRTTLRNNGLSITMFAIFLATLLGLVGTGHRVYNEEQASHGEPGVALSGYLTSGHFVEAVFENWESEFLQMGAYVFLTVFLFQKGSPESNDPDGAGQEAPEPRAPHQTPWPVRRGGWVLKVYEHSLSLAMLLLFVGSFALHVRGGAIEKSEEARAHGEAAVSSLEFLGTAELWFQSFQNWQSEFLSIGVLVVLAIFLREKGSPESKPIEPPPARLF